MSRIGSTKPKCAARCLGVAGHHGPHQTVDGRPLLFDTPEDRERVFRLVGEFGGSDSIAAAVLAALRRP